MTQNLLPWYWRSLPLQSLSASQVFERLFYQPHQICTLLESPFPTPTDYPYLSRYSICAGTPRQGENALKTPPQGQVLSCLRELLSPQPPTDLPELPFTGGWLGWLGYDLAREIENLPYTKTDTLSFPVAYWYAPENFAVLDHQEQILWLAATYPHGLDTLEKHLEQPFSLKFSPSNQVSFPLHFATNQENYEQAVTRALQYIQAGDIFQANLSLRFHTHSQAHPWELYRTLQRINPSPFASYWQTPWGMVISCSPERLVQLQGQKAQTRPIAGTRPRGSNPKEEGELADELLENGKERAEHIMLVDLERNDLGKVCVWGSVEVDELLTLERYSHVMHLVSNVRGILRPEYGAVDLIKAVFPGGTITGCPKVRCLEIIEELEPVRRSLFYGSCGYLDQRGNLDLNILIRTLLLTPSQGMSQVFGQVGAGIVADSNPTQEWHESLSKAQAQLLALQVNFS
jgi:para-aminobenzoate synthetase component 1